MSTGLFVLIGIFVMAAGFALWNARLRRGVEQRLRALGFEPCAADAPMLERAWRAFEGDPERAPEREIRVGRCLRRAAGWGLLHHFQVSERVLGPELGEPSAPSLLPAYLLDLREPDAVARAPVTLYLLPPGNRLARALIEKTIGLAAPGRKLELAGHPATESILAAYGPAPGKLDDVMPAGVQQRLARAAAHGFLCVHLGGGKAGFAVLPNHRDVDAQLAYLAEWC
jgi:hypothetical protein